jgi:hypothetical protein
LHATGCSLASLWQSFGKEVDVHSKDKLWQELRKCNSDLEFFIPLTPEGKIVCTEQGILNYERTSLEVIHLSLMLAQEKDVRIVASLSLRYRVLGVHDVCVVTVTFWFCLTLAIFKPHIRLNSAQYCALECVGKARAEGVLQSRLAKLLEVDSRTFFHHVKQLKSLGLLYGLRTSVSFSIAYVA